MNTLSGHTLKNYDEQLGQLLALILEMGGSVRTLGALTVRALSERSEMLVQEGKAADKQINRLEGELEEAATVTLALQHPMAVDLRFVISALKISAMLERAGDLAKNIIKRCVPLAGYDNAETLEKLARMAEIFTSMLDDALRAVKERDAELAIAVWRRDAEVDALNRELFAAMQREMTERPERIPACTHLLFIAKNYERMADYVTSVAKTVHYIVTGQPAHKSLLTRPENEAP